MPQTSIAIVGAGLAGLSCALRLQEHGVDCQVFEKSDCVGGRVKTHVVDGFRLDLGFQVLLTAYPRTQQMVDYAALELKSFHAGAQIRFGGKFNTLGDPSRRPADALATLLSPVGSVADKLRVLRLRNQVLGGTVQQLLTRPETTTEVRLREYGFSRRMIKTFFRPFLGGIFLEPNLVTSSRKFEFVMRMFSQGEAALPKLGMQAIPQQLANGLKSGILQMATGVRSLNADGLTLDSGEIVKAEKVVLATTEVEAARLQEKPTIVRSAGVTCLYYCADRSPVQGPWLVLNGEGKGPINNLCVPTELHRNYAPSGKTLISVTVLSVVNDEVELEREVRSQLASWYGKQVDRWLHLRTYSISEALTLQEPPALQKVRKPVTISNRLLACGDYLSITSIEGAISSGVRCADAIYEAQ